MLRVLLHLSWGMVLGLWLRLRQGEHWHQRRSGQATICRWTQQLNRILGLHCHVSGKPSTKPALLVANHISWLEIIALGSLQPTRFLAKDDVRRWPLIGALAAIGGTLFIHRHSNSALRRTQTEVAQALRAGQRVLIFPEGTTTDGQQVKRFHSGLFEAARSAHCTIQPIAIRYSRGNEVDRLAPFIDDDAFIPHLWHILQRGNTHITVHFCAPLPRLESRQQLAQRSRESIVVALAKVPLPETTAQ
jgi:1-acyl-sn-glycerol-3-phosphate acyltransferase